MPRFSNLSPLQLNKEVKLLSELIFFFTPLNNKNIKKKMSIETDNEKVIKPLSLFDFTLYQKKFNKYNASKDCQHIINLTRKMELTNYLSFAGTKGYSGGLEKCYYFMKEFTNIQKKGVFWQTEILGFSFLIEKIKAITIQLVGEDKNNKSESCGTGILINENIIITCAHVINDMDLYSEQYVNGKKVSIVYSKAHDKIDVGYIMIDEKFDFSSGLGIIAPEILDKILVTGFPKIPFSKTAPIVSQQGEVNSFIQDFEGNNYFLFSSITRPGNSGGPIFSRKGYLVGIVSRINERKGDNSLPFFVAVPAPDIITAINELNDKIKLSVENYE
jgi:S1-C subfamily serine protease